jgi:hypothetical protein
VVGQYEEVVSSVADVAARWRRQYPRDNVETMFCRSTDAVYRALLALPADAGPSEVACVIGNAGWWGECCAACGDTVQAFVRAVINVDVDVVICVACVGRMAAAVHLGAGRGRG